MISFLYFLLLFYLLHLLCCSFVFYTPSVSCLSSLSCISFLSVEGRASSHVRGLSQAAVHHTLPAAGNINTIAYRRRMNKYCRCCGKAVRISILDQRISVAAASPPSLFLLLLVPPAYLQLFPLTSFRFSSLAREGDDDYRGFSLDMGMRNTTGVRPLPVCSSRAGSTF